MAVKVLLVEDDVALRDIYSARFMAEGYDVVTASDGEMALTQAVREKPSLIILDVMMPKISGFDVLDILRATPETKNTKVIMMTALSQESDVEKGNTLGADEYLVKSQVTLTDVISKAKQVLAR
ncbi:MAG: response regulator [bacterium]